MSFRALIKSDLSRFAQTYSLRGQAFSRRRVFWESFLFKAGFQAVVLYRISHWFYRKKMIYLAWFFSRLNLTLTGAEIEFNAEIGPALFIAHPVGIVIGRGTIIGYGATLFQGVSFGVRSWHPEEITKFPKVGNNCFFFAHSVIVGDVTIGNECVIGTNAVVNCDIPNGSMALGIPAKIFPQKGKEAINSWNIKIKTDNQQ